MQNAFRRTIVFSLCLLMLCVVGCTDESSDADTDLSVGYITDNKTQAGSDGDEGSTTEKDAPSGSVETKADVDAGWSDWIS